MKIGNIDIGYRPVVLAPMEDVTDRSFRLLCREFGADMVYSEFVSSDAIIRSIPSTIKKMQVDDAERPVSIQIYGRDAFVMSEAAKMVMQANPDILDINFGCPVKRVAWKGAGSGMLKTPNIMIDIIEAVVKAVNIPVTVKTRLGWDDNSKIIVELAERIQDAGASALTIHGRTRAQMYTGSADWSLIGAVKNNNRMKIPIIGNGDLSTPEDVLQAFDKYGVDGVMIGRASIGKPWIFEDIKYYMKNGKHIPIRPISFYISVLKKQIESNIVKLDEKRGILHSRRHISTFPYFKGLANFKSMRIQILRADNKEELFNLLDESEKLISI